MTELKVWRWDAETLASYLGVSRMTLYRWAGLVPYPSRNISTNYDKLMYDPISAEEMDKWLGAVHRKLNRYNRKMRCAITKVRNVVNGVNVTNGRL